MKVFLRFSSTDFDMVEMFSRTETGLSLSTYLWAVFNLDCLDDQDIRDRIEDGETVEMEIRAV